MPDVDDEYARRGRLLPVLFWAGVGLAPLAGLLVLLGGGASLRVGAFLAVVALLLIGLSVALRPDPNAVRLQLEETLLEELDRLRAEVREDIAGASRATHQTVGERLGAMQQVIDSLRGERARYAAPRSAPPPAVHHPAVHHPAAQHPAAQYPAAQYPAAQYPAAQHPAAPPPGRYGQGAGRLVASHPVPPYPGQPRSVPPVAAAARSAPPGAPAGRHPAPPSPVAAPVAGNGQPVGGRRAARHQADPPREPVGGRATPPPPPTGGVYRHTETVQVTTRSTYVDEPAPNGDGGRRYDGGYAGHDWSGAGSPGRAAEPDQESWTDQKLRERYGRRPRPYDRAEDESGEQPWTRRSAPWEEPVSAAPVSGGRGTGRGSEGRRHQHRWDDDGSGELQLGERRARARGDGNGTELRLEERWASVRRDRDENGYGRPDYRADHGSDHRDPDYSRPALPSSSSEPSWNDSWDEPVRESRGHRYQPDFELSDERWR